MAFSTKEQEIIDYGIKNKKSAQEIKDAVTRVRLGLGAKVAQTTPQTPSYGEQVKEAAVSGVQGGIETAKQGLDIVGDGSSLVDTVRGGTKVGAGIAQGVLGGVFSPLAPIFKPVADGFKKVTDAIGGTKFMQEAADGLPQDNALEKSLSYASDVGNIADLAVAGKGAASTIRTGAELTSKAVKTTTNAISDIKIPQVGDVTSLFKRKPVSVEDAMAQADDALRPSEIARETPNINVNVKVPRTKIDLDSVNKRLDALIAQGKTSEARVLAEATGPKLSMTEKLAGLRPDIKQRIQGKPDLMREYIDVVNTRNLTDTVPTVSEYGGNYVRKAADAMQGKLSETGAGIGKTRLKLATYKAPIDDVVKIEQSFTNQLDKLNLELKGGVIQQKSGTISRVSAAGDIKVLQDLYSGIETFKQSPTLTNAIDLRTSFDSKINFAKRSSEVSNSVDPLSRQVRSDIANVAAKVVGKENAADLKRYSDFMDAYNDIHSYTDRAAGGEYLIRLVLSGRGGEARQLINTVKEYTGIDLMDHATMMQVTNEMLGNAAQKNLFRQEATKAGLDVARLLGGDPTGAAATLFDKGIDRLLNPEKILLRASQ
jgi:hypothetical protein